MHIIAREKELETLELTLNSSQGEMVGVYGRLGVGKSYLIKEFYRDKTNLFVLEGEAGAPASVHLKKMARAIAETFSLTKLPATPRTWCDAFTLLEEQVHSYKGTKKLTILFDEVPWLSGQNSKMVMWLGHFWNRYAWHNEKVILVVCGSDVSWMKKKIVHDTGNLYQRLTQRIHLSPFTIQESARYLISKGHHLSSKQLMELYLVTGGVAQYLNLIPLGLSTSEAIQALCFSKGGPLTGAFTNFYTSIYGKTKRHLEALRALANSERGLTQKEIATKSSLSSGGRLGETLDELEESGFITSIPFFRKRKRDAMYRIVDPLTLFHIRFIEPSLNNQESPPKNHWEESKKTKAYTEWANSAFESFCLEHIGDVLEELKISVVTHGLWHWSYVSSEKDEFKREAHIKLMIERRDKVIHILDFIFSPRPIKLSRRKAQKFSSNAEVFRSVTNYPGAIFFTLVTFSGSERNMPYLSHITHEVVIENVL